MKDEQTTIDDCIQSIKEWIYAETDVSECDYSVDKIKALLELRGEPYLNDSECYDFICGGEDGEIPQHLIDRFPELNEYLNSFLC